MASATVALRSLVMWAMLIGVPLAALVWTPAGEFVDSLLAEQLREYVDWGSAKRRPKPALAAEPPAFAAAQAPARAAPDAWSVEAAPPPLANSPQPFRPSAASPLSRSAPAMPAWNPSQWSSGPSAAGGRRPAGAPSSPAAPLAVRPVSYEGSSTGAPTPLGPLVAVGSSGDRTSGPAAPAAASSASADPFGDRFSRLQALGAQYYLLETWGTQSGLYRFHCKMSLTGSSGYIRHFEATDADPLQAIDRVLGEVEAWRRQTR